MSSKSRTSEIKISGSNIIGNIGNISGNSVVSVRGGEKVAIPQEISDMQRQLQLFLLELDKVSLPSKDTTYLKEDVHLGMKAITEQADIERLLEQLTSVNSRLERLERNGKFQSVASSASLTGFIYQVVEIAKASL